MEVSHTVKNLMPNLKVYSFRPVMLLQIKREAFIFYHFFQNWILWRPLSRWLLDVKRH